MGIKAEEIRLGKQYTEKNSVEFEVTGRTALFADPIVSAGGEKSTYEIPTYEAIKGVLKSIYWKPTFEWIVDKVRVMNPIKMETRGVKLPKLNGGNDLAYYTYLMDVRYQVAAHLEWNMNRPEYERDRDQNKHYGVFAKSLMRGGRRDVFLGKHECVADVKPYKFGDGKGAFDGTGTIRYGYMYHGINYPDEGYSDESRTHLLLDISDVTMENGIITFKRPEECLHKPIRRGAVKEFQNVKEDANASVL
ncbi:MAG: type I-C CRISPR-associated protein Cas5c [Bilifractor sp.]|jgi:CRISPR-associated protein Cas5d